MSVKRLDELRLDAPRPKTALGRHFRDSFLTEMAALVAAGHTGEKVFHAALVVAVELTFDVIDRRLAGISGRG